MKEVWKHGPSWQRLDDSVSRFSLYLYILFNRLTDNTRRYFASCIVFFQALKGQGKIQAMSKMSVHIIF